MLEINGSLPAGQVGASQISGATDHFRDDIGQSSQDTFRELTGGNGSIGRGEFGQSSFPAFRELTAETAFDFGSFGREFLLVLGKESVPGSFGFGTMGSTGSIQIIDLT
jgi:hypothetical protein